MFFVLQALQNKKTLQVCICGCQTKVDVHLICDRGQK